MNREQFIQCLSEDYGVAGEYLWAKYPRYCVFRHPNNHRWFAVVMDVPKTKLGLPGTGILDVVNFFLFGEGSPFSGLPPPLWGGTSQHIIGETLSDFPPWPYILVGFKTSTAYSLKYLCSGLCNTVVGSEI